MKAWKFGFKAVNWMFQYVYLNRKTLFALTQTEIGILYSFKKKNPAIFYLSNVHDCTPALDFHTQTGYNTCNNSNIKLDCQFIKQQFQVI